MTVSTEVRQKYQHHPQVIFHTTITTITITMITAIHLTTLLSILTSGLAETDYCKFTAQHTMCQYQVICHSQNIGATLWK